MRAIAGPSDSFKILKQVGIADKLGSKPAIWRIVLPRDDGKLRLEKLANSQ